MPIEQPLLGKTAVVTGAGQGIGKAIAIAFARAGADLAICARSQASIEPVRDTIEEVGRRCHTAHFDLGDAEATKAFCVDLLNTFGTVDIITAAATKDNAASFYLAFNDDIGIC